MTKIGEWLSGLLFSSLVFAQTAPQVQLLVDRERAGVGEPITVTIDVSSSEQVPVVDPEIPPIPGLQLVNQTRGSSMSVKLMMGSGGPVRQQVQRTEFNFVFIPTKKGRVIIPALNVNVAGTNYTTKPVTLQIEDPGVGAPPSQAQPRGGRPGGTPDPFEILDADPEEIFNRLMQRSLGRGMGVPGGGGPGPQGPAEPVVPKNENELFFIHTEVDKKTAFEGEQITVNWYMYVKGNLVELGRTKFPDLKGFWKEIIEEVPAPQFTQEVINGQVYKRALLASHALFPIKQGNAVIDEFRIKGKVQALVSSLGGMAYGQTYAINRASDRVTIQVKPLPTENRPSDFTGAVGDFQIQVGTDSNVVTAHQPFVLRVRFEGAGNAKLIEMPPVTWPAGLEVYETKSESKFFKNGQSYKQFDVLLIPRQEGDLQIPAITSSFFDPKTAQYVSRSTEPLALKVLPGQAPPPGQKIASPSAPAAPKGPVLPAPVPELVGASTGFWNQSLWSLAGLSYITVFGLLGLRTRQFLFARPKSKDFAARLKLGIKAAKGHGSAGRYRETGTTMINLMNEIIGGLSNQEGVDLEFTKALEQIPPSVRREVGPDLMKSMDVFQTLAFAPEAALGSLKAANELQKQVKDTEVLLARVIRLTEKSDQGSGAS